MKFGLLQLNLFHADEGAYSIVTADERDNSQITLTETDGEAAIAIRALGREKIPRKAARSQPLKVYVASPDGSEQQTTLTINFPKARGDELRIYRNSKQGFAYEAGDVWFIFRRNRDLFVGSMTESQWRSIGRSDPDDDIYVESIYEPEKLALNPARISSMRYVRDRTLALNAMKRAGYKCEAEPEIGLFIARSTGKPYLEPHHLIPMCLQKSFSKSLDHPDNIYCLSPHHHRRIHLGTAVEALDVIVRLLTLRNKVKSVFGVTESDLYGLYNCLIISK